MNSLITTRQITPADVLAERAARAKVLYSPCIDQDIKWRWCECYVCRSVWDPTGEKDAERANAARLTAQSSPSPPPSPPPPPLAERPSVLRISPPISLPDPEGTNEVVTISGADTSMIIQLLEKYSAVLSRSISKIISDMESRITDDYLPIAPPELDNLSCTKTQTENMIHHLRRKPRM